MQLHTAAPREHLTQAQVLHLLQGSPSIQTSFGANLLDLALNKIGEVPLLGGSVRRNFYANIHGTCDLEIDQDVSTNHLVQPWQELSYNGVTARWNVGVYSLTTPLGSYGQNPRDRRVQGYDRTYLLAREIGASHIAPAGAKVLDEVRRIVSLSGLSGVLLDSTKESVTLAEPMIWPLVRKVDPTIPDYDRTEQQRDGVDNAVTYLRVANDLLFSINYRGIYADPSTGLYRSEPYVRPVEQPATHIFDFDDPRNSIVVPERTLEQDSFKAPNHWVFVRSNMPGQLEPTVANGGVYIVDRTANDARALKWSTQIALEVADYASLVSQGDNRVAKDQRVQSKITVKTASFPAAGHGDVYRYIDVEMNKNVKVLETEWTLDLAGGDMTRNWEVVG